ncbi:MAG: hypothetical protein S4CHLAM45_03630 [Chlamydiales bacterium]|nr:hypothetical protein [Chlamydiales bacterium]MCH9619218.1 hypothetical protein [Chlamydiales bacterium]MCH9622480.1 hypothetical protein [Chlamydiales bacterium]
MNQKLLLINDVDGLGRSGEIVTAKPGFFRNFLLPQGHAVVADKQTIKLQANLQAERAKRAAVDKKEAEAFAAKLGPLVLETEVKVDTEGKMYGSVNQNEIAKMLQGKGFEIERKNVTLPQAIKKLGKHTIPLRLKEGVEANVTLKITPEGGLPETPLPEAPAAEAKEIKEEAE